MLSEIPSPVNSSVNPLGGWQQGQLLEIDIQDLTDQGDGVGRWQDRVVFVPDTVPGDRIQVRLVRVKPGFAHGKLHEILTASPYRQRPACFVADKCGGCQWQHIQDAYQVEAKYRLVKQALERIGGFVDPPVAALITAPDPLGYRNKVTYPLRASQSGKVQAGYYQKGTHQVINLNQCPIQDIRFTPLLTDVKQDIQQHQWPIYDERIHQGALRHLGFRIGRRTGEQLLTLVSCHANLLGLEQQAQVWLQRYPDLVGVALNLNPHRTNAIFGSSTQAIAGRLFLEEEFAGLRFQIQPTTFFQVFTEQAERLLEVILNELNLQGDELLLDAYCGVGTLTLPLALRVRHAVGLELQAEAVAQAQRNADLNQIDNVTFQVGAIETLLPQWSSTPDIVVLDPPRKGCDRKVLDALLSLKPARIVYVSCNPATLARDLQILSQSGIYQLTGIQPADFFPQTAHVEAVAFLSLRTLDFKEISEKDNASVRAKHLLENLSD